MRVLLSVVGTRGDVQPVIALALAVRALGHEVRLGVPPNFIAWAEGLGFTATPVGIEMRAPRSPRGAWSTRSGSRGRQADAPGIADRTARIHSLPPARSKSGIDARARSLRATST